MAYKHGVYTLEVPTSIIPAVNTTAGLPVVFGTAPVHLAQDRAASKYPWPTTADVPWYLTALCRPPPVGLTSTPRALTPGPQTTDN